MIASLPKCYACHFVLQGSSSRQTPSTAYVSKIQYHAAEEKRGINRQVLLGIFGRHCSVPFTALQWHISLITPQAIPHRCISRIINSFSKLHQLFLRSAIVQAGGRPRRLSRLSGWTMPAGGGRLWKRLLGRTGLRAQKIRSPEHGFSRLPPASFPDDVL